MMRRPPRSTLFPYPALFRPRAATRAGPASLVEDERRGVDLQGLAAEELRVPSAPDEHEDQDRKSTRLNSSHANISYAVFCLKKKKKSQYRSSSSSSVSVFSN